MPNQAKDDRPKIHVNARGGMYVKADDLLRSSKVRTIIEKMTNRSGRKLAPPVKK